MKKFKVLGLMSGTSMDGLDCGLFNLSLSPNYQLDWKCEDFNTIPYSKQVRHLIENALSGYESYIMKAHIQLGDAFASFVKKFLDNRHVDLIAFHGQTIAHQDGVSTRQIGDPKNLYNIFKVPIIYNFRQADIDSGGNGAPLMPFLDWILFKEREIPIITLNLGGVANISYIPKSGKREDVLGFDTGPGMSLIDETCRILLDMDMDHNGIISRSGSINQKLLNELMSHEFIRKDPPKSTGRHEFGKEMVYNIIEKYPRIKTEDLLRTFSMFTAKSVAINLRSFLNINSLETHLIVSGGGIHHQGLISDLKEQIDIINFKTADNYGIKSKMKESLLMAVLGTAYIQNMISNIPSVSGADSQTVLGQIYRPE